MNKKVIAAVVILLVLIGGYFGYTKLKGGSITTPGTTTESGGMKSLKDLLSLGVTQKCTFSQTGGSGTSEGTTYVSGGKVRGDFTTTSSGKTMITHMISDGKTSYIWTEGEKTGFKMTAIEASPSTVQTGSADTPVNSQADLDQKADYKCSGWTTDGSLFTPPTNVTFTDFSQMLNPSAAPSQCSYCDSLTGDDKTQCMAAFKCN